MTDLGKAYVQIVPSADGISGSISEILGPEAQRAGEEAGENAGNSLAEKMKKIIAAAGIGLAIKKSIDAVGDLAAYGDEIDKMSQKMGISAQAYQEWDAILQHSGSSINAMKPAFKTLQAQAIANADAFQALGISQEEVANLSQEDLFAKTIEGLQNVSDENERAELANKLLGRSYMELGPLLNTSAADTEAMRQRVHELGGVMSDEAVKASAAYQDSLQDMNTALAGMGRTILANFLPSFTGIMDGISMIFSGDPAGGVGMIMNGIGTMAQTIINGVPQMVEAGYQLVGGVISSIGDKLPEVLEQGGTMLQTMANGFLTNLPSMISSVGTVITNVISYLLSNLPKFLSKGMEIVGSLASGIIRNLPAILSSMGQLLVKLVTTIIQKGPEFLKQGLQLIVKMATGIIQGIPKILSAGKQIFSNLGNYIRSVNWAGLGRNIIDGIVRGLRAAGSAVKNFLKNIAKGALDSVKRFFGIKSPSRVMADEVGRYLPLGIAQGIEKNASVVQDAMYDLAGDVTAKPVVNAMVTGSRSTSASGSSSSTTIYGGVPINIYASDYGNAKEVAQEVMRIIKSEMNSERMVFA